MSTFDSDSTIYHTSNEMHFFSNKQQYLMTNDTITDD